MAQNGLQRIVQCMRRAVLLHDGAGLSDGQLLEAYLHCSDEAALEAIIRRHASMVWGVCRRVLRNHHDAEDAFQATFLVLIRRASAVASRDLIANWLYGVAYQTARKARATVAKKLARERALTRGAEPAGMDPDNVNDLRALVDEEIALLPDKYREVIILCDLEGKTRKDAARQLQCPEGTVAGRLARARLLLAKRFSRRGIASSAGALAAMSPNAISAGAPISMISSLINAARLNAAGQATTGAVSATVAALTEGVLKTMFLTKLKTGAVLAILVVAALSAGGVGYQTQWRAAAKEQRGQIPFVAQPPANQAEQPKGDAAVPTKSGRDVVATFEENQARGDDEFVGKKVRVSGKLSRVEGIGITRAAHMHRVMEAPNQYYLVTLRLDLTEAMKANKAWRPNKMPLAFLFPAAARKELGELKSGQDVTIEGTCEGRKSEIEYFITFTGCKVVNNK
jgi:RNA polymerase sigma factor (sigma-70 family)